MDLFQSPPKTSDEPVFAADSPSETLSNGNNIPWRSDSVGTGIAVKRFGRRGF